MYYPVQIPYILSNDFSKDILYSEEIVEFLKNFIICFWEMQPRSDEVKSVENIIVTDGCIDLVVEYDEKQVGFSGMSKTDFHFNINLPSRSFGARLKPGAFHQLTGLPAKDAMNTFLPVNVVDKNFDCDYFFSLSFKQAKEYFKNYFYNLVSGKTPEYFTLLFDELSQSTPPTADQLYKQLHFSSRQCQRLFEKHFGITPQTALCIIRFQQCLKALISGKADYDNILSISTYYDQSHFIKDFKRNIGITPLELIRKYIN